jgi:hypothetical protein
MRGCRDQSTMTQSFTCAESPFAHARLCRKIARATRDEEIAQRLERLAEDCIRAAGDGGGRAKRAERLRPHCDFAANSLIWFTSFAQLLG